jgi:hypothetical protein
MGPLHAGCAHTTSMAQLHRRAHTQCAPHQGSRPACRTRRRATARTKQRAEPSAKGGSCDTHPRTRATHLECKTFLDRVVHALHTHMAAAGHARGVNACVGATDTSRRDTSQHRLHTHHACTCTVVSPSA